MENFENYIKEEKTFDIVKANVIAIIVIIPIALVFGLPYLLIWKDSLTVDSMHEATKSIADNFLWGGAPVIFIALVSGIVLHELIHGITWLLAGRNGWRSIKFGILWKMLTPYCHSKKPMKVKHYMLGAIMPGIILGIIPSIASWFNGNIPLLIFGIFFTIAATGDFIIIYLLRKENRNDFVLDHPSEAGCFIFRLKS